MLMEPDDGCKLAGEDGLKFREHRRHRFRSKRKLSRSCRRWRYPDLCPEWEWNAGASCATTKIRGELPGAGVGQLESCARDEQQPALRVQREHGTPDPGFGFAARRRSRACGVTSMSMTSSVAKTAVERGERNHRKL